MISNEPTTFSPYQDKWLLIVAEAVSGAESRYFIAIKSRFCSLNARLRIANLTLDELASIGSGLEFGHLSASFLPPVVPLICFFHCSVIVASCHFIIIAVSCHAKLGAQDSPHDMHTAVSGFT